MTETLIHVLSGLEVGGKERVVLQLARRARRDGINAQLVLFDTPFRSEAVDFDPGDVPVHFLPRRPGLDVRFAVALARLLRSLNAGLVHAHNDTAMFYACAAALLGRSRSPAVCATIHTRPPPATALGRRLTRWLSERADGITAVSQELAGYLVATGWVLGCETLWNGVDLDEFTPAGPTGGWRSRLGIPADAMLVGHIGRFDRVKRQVDLIDAARLLSRSKTPVIFVLVGQGPTADEVLAASAGCESIRFVPRIIDVAAFLRELDLFILCSEHEAAPRVLLEAMACGCAVVATAVGGVPSLLTRGDGATVGAMIPPRRPDLIANVISELSKEPARRLAMGTMAREAVAGFSAEAEWCGYAKLYEAAMSHRREKQPPSG